MRTPALLKADAQLRDVLGRRGLGWICAALGDAAGHDVPFRDADALAIAAIYRSLGSLDTLSLLADLVRERGEMAHA